MSARLIAIAGPLEGQVFPLAEALTIGRDRGNHIPIDDPMISRRHCVLRSASGSWTLSDLNSMNGTYVNGMPIQERVLEDGDQIQLGRSLFAASLRDPAKTETAGVEMDERHLTTGATLMLRVGDSRYTQTDKMLEGLPQVWRNARHLEILLKLGAVVASTHNLDPLANALLELVLDAVPAQRCALLLFAGPDGEIASQFHVRRGDGASGMRVPQQLVSQVVADGVALVSNDVADGSMAAAAGDGIRALAAVPLIALGRSLGVIYLDTTDALAQFDDEHLQLLTGIAGLAGAAIDQALHVRNLERDNERLQAEINLRHSMVGESQVMRAVYAFIAKAAPAASTVLIRGESGTGKELVARAVHRTSPRSARPFIAINCAALAETLLESEFFGHEKGAFTGAIGQRKGKLEDAEGGTVFLDEIGELAPSLQAKLLRVLQEREFQRVGGNRTIKVDIRVIAATNRDLEEEVRKGAFREDLYYRLNVVSIRMPSLRERREDVALLAHYFAQKHARLANRTVNGVSAAARAALLAHDWPGNVRELENAIERAVVLGSTEMILPEDLPESIVENSTQPEAAVTKFHEAVAQAKRQIVLRALEQSRGSYTEAARALGLHPSNLHRLIRTLGLRGA